MFKVARFLFDFYIDASIHVALSVYALLYLFILNNNLQYDEALVYTIFYGSITGYNLVKYAPVAKLNYISLTKNLKIIQVFSLICFVALGYYAIQLPSYTILSLIVGLFIILSYVLPIFKNKNLRSVGKLKIYLVALCWTLATVVVSIVHYNLSITYQLVLEALQVFILVVALVIPFDIRDLEYDTITLKTIPQRIGVKKSKIIACSLLCVYFVIDIILRNRDHYLVVALTIIVAYLLIYKMPKKPIKYYCSFGIESVPILKLVLYLIIIR